MLQVKQELVLRQADILSETNEKLEEANQELTVLNTTKDKLFSIIAHDLKNPFNTVLGFSEILQKNFQDLSDEKIRRYIAAIYDSSHRIFKLLENLLQWAGTQTGNVIISPGIFNSGEVINANVELVQETIKEKGIVLTKIVPEDSRIYADRNMFDTIVRNLVGNAIKYTEQGTISVIIENNAGYQKISIADSGTGISEDNMKKIFGIDHTKSVQGTRGETGSGLGLIICREFVLKNGGEITVKSVQGKGSIFSFTVPRMATHT
jgi:signal transduction histidine kinase